MVRCWQYQRTWMLCTKKPWRKATRTMSSQVRLGLRICLHDENISPIFACSHILKIFWKYFENILMLKIFWGWWLYPHVENILKFFWKYFENILMLKIFGRLLEQLEAWALNRNYLQQEFLRSRLFYSLLFTVVPSS